MALESFETNRAFFAPAFRIKLNGQETGREVIADVLELSFVDDLDNIDSFEFVLNDWDVVKRRPRYSSPWDARGQLLQLESGHPVPVFEPGAKVNLFMGYAEEGELPLIMQGEVISLTPAFPASGAPTCRVRALDSFQRDLQKVHVEGNYTGTKKGIVDKLCRENDITVKWSPLDDGEGSEEKGLAIEGLLFDEIQKRVQGYGLSMVTVPAQAEGEKPTLFLAAPSLETSPVAKFTWGATLTSFSPVLSAKGQVAKVVVRWGNPDAKGQGRIEVSKTWADIGLSPTALGPAGKADLDKAVRGLVEIIKPSDVRTEADATREALKHLREMAKSLITGSGSCIGLPTLRAGKLVDLAGLGPRFDGKWRLTQTSHTMGGGGYTTSFQARKEILQSG